jgi:hypothetical protein
MVISQKQFNSKEITAQLPFNLIKIILEYEEELLELFPLYENSGELFTLELMSNLPNNDPNQALSCRIYVSLDDGDCVARDSKGATQKVSLKNKGIDLSHLPNRLNDEQLKLSILGEISNAGHTLLSIGSILNVLILASHVPSGKVSYDASISLVPTLFNSIKTTRIKPLLTHIVNGEPIKAKAILDKYPSLVFEKLEEDFVTALSGHKFNVYPYQAATLVRDTQMAAMIKPYFSDEKEANKQLEEIYRLDKKEEEKWQSIFEQRDQKLIPAIRDSKDDIISSGAPNYIITLKKDSPIEKELLKFWELLDATRNNVITPRKIPFNDDLYLTTLQIYDNDDSYNNYFGGDLEDPRALFFVQYVIGYRGIQGLMPVNYVQAHQDGLCNTEQKLRNNEPQGRSTRFEIYRFGDWIPIDFYPRAPRMSADSNFMIYGRALSCGGGGCRAGVWGGRLRAPAFRILCQSKTAGLQTLCTSKKEKTTPKLSQKRSFCSIT